MRNAAFALLTLILAAAADGARAQPRDLRGGLAGRIDPLNLPDIAIPAPASTELTRDDVLRHFAECAARVVNVFFNQEVGVLSRSTSRAAFWGCAFGNGWPQPVLGDFFGNRVDIAESILTGGDSDVSSEITVYGLGVTSDLSFIRKSNCANYENLWTALYMAMTPSARNGLTEPDGERICGR